MAKIRVAIYDEDVDYSLRLMNYLNGKYGRQIDAVAFSKKEHLMRETAEYGFDYVVTTDVEDIGAVPVIRIIEDEREDGYYRYGSAKTLAERIVTGFHSDPASVAFDTLSSAVANHADVVIIDTAGRLHNKIGLMNELTKIKNVMKKVVPDAPNEVLLVLDGSTGQNAFEQAKQFSKATEVTAMAITKLDGTAKGGVVIGISDQFKIPVKYIGLGEGIEDLQVFNKTEFVNSLFGAD